jgi:hypothetical protein
MYVEKKNCLEEFEKQTRDFSNFLSMVIIRLEALVRKVLTNTYNRLLDMFSITENLEAGSALNAKRGAIFCLLELKLVIKEQKI